MEANIPTKLVFANWHSLVRLVRDKEQPWQGPGCPEQHQEVYIALHTRSFDTIATHSSTTREGTQPLQPTLIRHYPRPSTTPQYSQPEQTHNTAAMPDPPPAPPPSRASPAPVVLLIKCTCTRCSCSTYVELPAKKCSSCPDSDH